MIVVNLLCGGWALVRKFVCCGEKRESAEGCCCCVGRGEFGVIKWARPPAAPNSPLKWPF